MRQRGTRSHLPDPVAGPRASVAPVLWALTAVALGTTGCGGHAAPHALLSPAAAKRCLLATGAKVEGGRTKPGPGDGATPAVALLVQRQGTGSYVGFYPTTAAAEAVASLRPSGSVVLKGRRLVIYVATEPEAETKKAIEGCVF